MKQQRIIIAVLILGVLALGVADVAMAGKKKVKGMDLYKEHCKPCHMAESPHGEYTPMTLIQMQWERFFEKKYVKAHEDVIDEAHDGKKVTDVITEEKLKDIMDFCIKHAADSEHPMTCG